MAIETVDDIIEEIATWCGVYGSHEEGRCGTTMTCRSHWTSELRDRLDRAYEIKRKLEESK